MHPVMQQVDALLSDGDTGRAMAVLDAAIEREPQGDLLALRARLTMATAEDAPGETLREQLEWLTSPAGQQRVATGRERALADLEAAIALRDEAEWQLMRGDVLLDGGRWDEAEAVFSAVLARGATLPPEALERAELGVELARGGEAAACESLDELIRGVATASEGLGGTVQDAMAEAHEVLADLDARAAEADAQLAPVDERARNVAQSLARVHADVPERLGPFDPRELDRRARRFYDRALKDLTRRGYAHLADVEPLRHTELNGTRVLLRLAVSADHTTVAAIWRLRGPYDVMEAIELESLLIDGTFLRTNALGTANPFEQPPEIVQVSLPEGTAAATLVEVHHQRLAQAGATALPMRDVADVAAVQERERLLKREFARSRGWISDGELRGLLGGSYDELAARVREELAALLG